MRDNVAVPAFNVLHSTDNASDQNENGACKKRDHDQLPVVDLRRRVSGALGLERRLSQHSILEETRDDNEDGEKADLHEKTANDDVFARADLVVASSRHDTSSCALHQEGKNITKDKDLGEETQGNERLVGAVQHGDDSAQNHVDGGCKKRRSHKQKHRLDDEGCSSLVVLRRHGSGDAADDFTESADDERNDNERSFAIKRVDVWVPQCPVKLEGSICGHRHKHNGEDDCSRQRRRVHVRLPVLESASHDDLPKETGASTLNFISDAV